MLPPPPLSAAVEHLTGSESDFFLIGRWLAKFRLGRSFDEIISVIEGDRTVLLTFLSLFYTSLTVDDVMSVVNDTLTKTCFEAYPIMIFNDTRMVSVACLLGLVIATILGALLILG